jgi:imidazolonepropionase
MSELGNIAADETIDCMGRIILPTWCDSHTHLVFAATREGEFVDRINGLTYEEIAAKGGGILNSAKKLQQASKDDLYAAAEVRLQEVMKLGTGAIEIKSGYGLSVEGELKMLRVIKRLKAQYSIPIKATFLGAHAIPQEFKENRMAYIDLIIDEMLPKIAVENLADCIDVFCEKGYFTTEETDRILKAGQQYGLIPKVHVNQFNAIGGVEISVQNNALSVDHLEVITDYDIDILKASETMPVALPSCSFFLGIPYTNGKKIIDNGLPLALATDYNPGSTPSGNMNFVVSLACIQMKLTPEEAINAATINGAYAMNLSDKLGSISKGKLANFLITKPITSYNFIPYNFGNSCVDQVYIKGEKI